jgi:hypothetical protein
VSAGTRKLEACRNNPFAAKMKRSISTRAVARGLAPTEPTDNVLIAYAARDGTTANLTRVMNSSVSNRSSRQSGFEERITLRAPCDCSSRRHGLRLDKPTDFALSQIVES